MKAYNHPDDLWVLPLLLSLELWEELQPSFAAKLTGHAAKMAHRKLTDSWPAYVSMRCLCAAIERGYSLHTAIALPALMMMMKKKPFRCKTCHLFLTPLCLVYEKKIERSWQYLAHSHNKGIWWNGPPITHFHKPWDGTKISKVKERCSTLNPKTIVEPQMHTICRFKLPEVG